ncbi:hypothetical protein ACFQV2_39680 [Actinokineospora soli]|uniref:FXSXX-COOH protein n=1 Tax=Actinokineospora soli TaxID=1048753 RepID=A0ABW2TXC2_9PSEU
MLSDVTGAKTEALLPAGTSELVAQLNSAAAACSSGRGQRR